VVCDLWRYTAARSPMPDPSMENTTRLLQRHEAEIARHHVLVVEADDPALAQLPARTIRLHSDDSSLPGRQPDWLPVLQEDTDLAIIILPKSRDRLRMLLACLAGQIRSPLTVWLVGAANGGIRGGATELAAHTDAVVMEDSARHCKLYSARLRPAAFVVDEVVRHWHYDGLRIESLPGVFSHGRLDEGTALLLDNLSLPSAGASVLDVGCGAGVLSAVLARAGSAVTAVDISATAAAATRMTLAANGLNATVLAGDLYGPVTGRFDLIISNPPFHDGLQRTTAISQRLILEAPRYLREQGRLLLVANQGLPYGDWLQQAFRQVSVLAENRRFRVWQASR
jgi:16S rRNA (guanine1207-N2)-methyltransferase